MVAAVRSPTLDPAQIVVDAFKPVAGEADTMLPVLEGRVPAALRGVLYRNGPGRLEVFGTQLTHPFDGDGMVSRFRFENGG
ncbi:MAG: carotenoid oxygenase family protein, partial [Myxococcota bacterium]